MKLIIGKILSLNIDNYLDNPSAIESRLKAIIFCNEDKYR